MYWTVIAINSTTESAEAQIFDLPHDSDAAEQIATEKLPGRTIIAMVKGNHSTGIHMPPNILSLYRTQRR